MSSTRRILVDTPYTATHTFYGDEGLLDPDANAVTVTITKGDGSTLVATTPATRVGAGVYSYTGDAVADLDHLSFTWAGEFSGRDRSEVDYADIVGGFVVSLAELRTQPNLGDTSKFTTDELRRARDWFETLAESYCGVAFTRRYRRVRVSGMGEYDIDVGVPLAAQLLSARVYSDPVTYTAFTASELADVVPTALGFRRGLSTWPFGSANVVVELTHGYAETPADVRDAALIAIRNKLLEDNTGRPAYAVADGAGGVTRYSTPGPGRPTGIFAVDEVLNRYRFVSMAGSSVVA